MQILKGVLGFAVLLAMGGAILITAYNGIFMDHPNIDKVAMLVTAWMAASLVFTVWKREWKKAK